ncbi:hypothetical protein BGX28_004666 [Mortierella sp. GBA30]|nr:hypothetical protein BGX28_004666 [Mortierella sp. GBA30]
MTILGIGIDILHLPRLKRVLLNHPERFLTRILTKSEQAEFRVIQEQAGGKPSLSIPEKAHFGISKSHATISHDGDYLIGQVLFESQ